MSTARAFAVARAAACALLGLSVGCASGAPTTAELEQVLEQARRMEAARRAARPEGAALNAGWYRGPTVVQANTGPARFAPLILERFDADRASLLLGWLDSQFRTPANDDFEAALDRLATELARAGYGASDLGLELEWLEGSEELEAWTPRSAKIELLTGGGRSEVLHAFEDRSEGDRVMLPVGAPSASLEGSVACTLAELDPGEVLVVEAPLEQVLEQAAARGAAAVLSASLLEFNVDPSGGERHLDAIQYRELHTLPPVPVAQISPRTLQRVRRACAGVEPVAIRFEAEVEQVRRPLRALVASVRGAAEPPSWVALVAHLQEPGANDNGTGVVSLLEAAAAIAEGLAAGELRRPQRGLAFVLGSEFSAARAFAASADGALVAAVAADMTGASSERTGALALLERAPDPGVELALPPDVHSAWGAGPALEARPPSHGLSLVARTAMHDVGLLEGGWAAAEHPFEGGSDHQVFTEQGVPAVLFWHFTDFTYHTSLDRLEMVDVDELRRTTAAAAATALAVADARPDDLARYLDNLDLEREVRVGAAREASMPELERAWQEWCDGVRVWLRALCLGISVEQARPPGVTGPVAPLAGGAADTP